MGSDLDKIGLIGDSSGIIGTARCMECRRRRSVVKRSETEEWSDSGSTGHTGFAKQNA